MRTFATSFVNFVQDGAPQAAVPQERGGSGAGGPPACRLPPSARRRGFTLIELLVVIGIIAVLASMLLPAVMRAIGQAEKTQAKTEVKALETAIKAFFGDYNRFPGAVSNGTGSTTATLTGSLRGLSTYSTDNPRGVVYLDVSEKSIGTNATDYAGSTGTVDVLYDPWGRPYQIAVDYQFNNTVASADGETLQGRNVAVWSWGPNNMITANSGEPTHIRSWR